MMMILPFIGVGWCGVVEVAFQLYMKPVRMLADKFRERPLSTFFVAGSKFFVTSRIFRDGIF